MTTHASLEGHVASDEVRRWERRFQFAGCASPAARETHGIDRLDQVDSAVLEQSGGISIVRKS